MALATDMQIAHNVGTFEVGKQIMYGYFRMVTSVAFKKNCALIVVEFHNWNKNLETMISYSIHDFLG